MFCCFFTGFILDATGMYEYVYTFSGSVLLLAAMCLVMILIVEALKKKCAKPTQQ